MPFLDYSKHSVPFEPSANYTLIDINKVDLNIILRDSINKVLPSVPELKLIVRCQSLPILNGNKKELISFFDEFIKLIITSNKRCSKIFLKAECDEQFSTDMNNGINKLKKIVIKIHTNIPSADQWFVENISKLGECKDLLFKIGGNLEFKNVENSSALIILTIHEN